MTDYIFDVTVIYVFKGTRIFKRSHIADRHYRWVK
jgi:hypothetical protein